MNQINNKTVKIELTGAELEVVNDLRKTAYGKVTVFVQDGRPFRKEVTEYRKLNKEGKFSPEREQGKPKPIEI